MHYKRFEELPVWKEAKEFIAEVYKLINTNKELRNDFALSDQLKRASYSILLNISEGFERGSKKDFANFINFAKGSAGEVRAILSIIQDSLKHDPETVKILYVKVTGISIQLSNFRRYLISNK